MCTRRLVEQAPCGCCGCSVRHYVQQFAAGGVDDAGGPRLVFEPAGAAEQGFVETHRGRRADPVDISVEQCLTTAQHRVVHRQPATRQVRCNVAHRTAAADLACRPRRCSCRQQRPRRRDLRVLFSHRPRAAITTGASPSVFVPHQPRRAAEGRQIHQFHRPVSFGPQLVATPRTRRTRCATSDMQPQRLATVVVDTQHVDFADTYRQLTHAYRVVFHRDPPVSGVGYDPDSGGSHPTDRQHPTTPTAPSNAKSPQTYNIASHRGPPWIVDLTSPIPAGPRALLRDAQPPRPPRFREGSPLTRRSHQIRCSQQVPPHVAQNDRCIKQHSPTSGRLSGGRANPTNNTMPVDPG